MRAGLASRAHRDGAVAGVVLALAVLLGSRGGRDLDPALFGYLAATFVAAVAGTARVSAFWRRRPSAFYGRAIVSALRDPRRLRTALASAGRDLGAQQPIAKRSRRRWLAHMALSLGTLASFAITLPLVFGWLHFEAKDQAAYVPVLTGIALGALTLDGAIAWLVFHGLSLAGVAVAAGAVYFLAIRVRTETPLGRAWRDLAPLLLLLAVAVSGLALPASRNHAAAFHVASLLHEALVVVLLVSLPFTKLGHVFIRPLQIGVRLVRAESEPRARCTGCGGALAPAAQIAAIEDMLAARGRHTAGHRRYCPACKRSLVAAAHSASAAASPLRGPIDFAPARAVEDA